MKVLFLLLSIFSASMAMAQQSASYEDLINSERLLMSQQDSLQSLIDRNRYLISTDPKSASKYNKEILQLEGDLFDVRDKLGVITTERNMIEEKMVLEKMNAARVDAEDVSSLAATDLYKENVSDADKRIISSMSKVHGQVQATASREQELYKKLSSALAELKGAEGKAQADSLRDIASTLNRRILLMDDSVKMVSDPIFDKKIEVYSILLDKLNVPMDLLDRLGQLSRDVRSQEYDAVANFQNPATAIYLRKRELAGEYEAALAAQLGLAELSAKVAKEKGSANVAKFDLPYLEIPNWNFVDFIPLTIGGKSVHSAKEPVADLDVASVGDMYKVVLGHYLKPQTNYGVFKRVYPVQQLMDAEGEGVTYFAGTYHTREEAEKDLSRVKKLGFSKAEVAMWSNGRRSGQDGDDDDSGDSADLIYRIEFADLTAGVKDIISEKAGDKEIARMVNSEGVGVFTLGIFSDKASADEVALLIDGAKVVEIK